jgi:hypothetical protein
LRNKDYLAYKRATDKIFIKIDNVTFWVKLTDVLLIGDIDNYAACNLKTIRKLKSLAWVLGYNTIRFQINKNINLPFLKYFKQHQTTPLCYYYMNEEFEKNNLVITAADFDTW